MRRKRESTPSSARDEGPETPQPLGARCLLLRGLVRRQRRPRPAQVVLRELAEEARRLALERLPRAPALAAIRQVQALLRARDADVHETALLVDVAGGDRLAVRKESFLDPDQ